MQDFQVINSQMRSHSKWIIITSDIRNVRNRYGKFRYLQIGTCIFLFICNWHWSCNTQEIVNWKQSKFLVKCKIGNYSCSFFAWISTYLSFCFVEYITQRNFFCWTVYPEQNFMKKLQDRLSEPWACRLDLTVAWTLNRIVSCMWWGQQRKGSKPRIVYDSLRRKYQTRSHRLAII